MDVEVGKVRDKVKGVETTLKRKAPPSSKKPEIMYSSFFLISCSTNMQG
jgi:hypothetical protein